MGRPPCCDTIGLKKGPWTPEEDIILVSYIQEHGPGNWRAVPTNAGLLRCSKSCRLRWANYLRPGIKRGAFNDQEEKLIIHLQALLGNRWAAIASYLPERTDNDIKNYWNTHLRKKLRKLQAGADDAASGGGLSACQPISRGRWESRLQTDIHMAKKALSEALSLENPDSLSESQGACAKPSRPTVAYASSTENISRLLEGWMRNSPKPSAARANSSSTQHSSVNNTVGGADSASSEGTTSAAERGGGGGGDNTAPPESMFRLDSPTPEASEASLFGEESKAGSGAQLPLSLIETWLFDESGGQGEVGLLDMQLDDTALYGRIEKLDDTAAEVF